MTSGRRLGSSVHGGGFIFFKFADSRGRLSPRGGIHDASDVPLSSSLPQAMVRLLPFLAFAGFVGLSLGQEK